MKRQKQKKTNKHDELRKEKKMEIPTQVKEKENSCERK